MAVRQEMNGRVQHRVHLLLWFADRQPAQRVAVKADLNQLFRRLPPQFWVHAALNNAEKKLTGFALRSAAALRPTRGEGRGLRRLVIACRVRNTGVQHHHDVRAKSFLHLNRFFRAEKELAAVQVRAELRALLGDFGQLLQAEYLEPAGIGENRPVPVHELVQSSENVTY